MESLRSVCETELCCVYGDCDVIKETADLFRNYVPASSAAFPPSYKTVLYELLLRCWNQRECSAKGHVACMQSLAGNLMGRNNLKDLDVDGMILLNESGRGVLKSAE